MFHCPIASLIPFESLTLSNLYIDAKHITSAPASICFRLIQLNSLRHNPRKINIIVIIINIPAVHLRKKILQSSEHPLEGRESESGIATTPSPPTDGCFFFAPFLGFEHIVANNEK